LIDNISEVSYPDATLVTLQINLRSPDDSVTE